ncbi:rab escort protein [Tasmannia lanceolata]|uniref:rab escort protein n=1 Tax=Tasmannia lanceolata TaxID=3420 RepID=UPI004062DEEE
MAENVSTPFIDPTLFDLIVSGTGLPESILAAGASSAGKSVLHLDSNPFYGSHFSSLPLHTFTSFLESQRNIPSLQTEYSPPSSPNGDFISIPLKPIPLYSNIDISISTDLKTLEPSRSFSLDLSGPRVLFCADPTVDLMLKSGASHHLEFKSVDGGFIYLDGRLLAVPISREGIFKDRSLGLTEKSQLMRFFKLVREHFGLEENGGEEEKRILEEDLESPLVVFLQKQRLPQKIKSIILYAIAMADYDQDSPEVCKKVLKTKDGIASLALYHSSVGRFPNALGAFIYPFYGQGELSQAFCRCAAVKGALYVLRMPVTSLLIDKENGHYKGVRLASGQDLFSHHLIIDPSFIVPPSVLSTTSDLQNENSEGSNVRVVRNSSSPLPKIARGVCITSHSIQPDLFNLLVVFPPRSLFTEQVTSVRALQLGSNVAVCPPGLFVLYFSTLCDDAVQGKESLQAAMNALFMLPVSNNMESSTSEINEGAEIESKPTLLWSATYVQELTEHWSDTISSCPMPDGNLDYRDLLESTIKLFHKMYPQEELFPESTTPDNTEDDGALLD